MPNKSHRNPGHRMMNYFNKTGRKHSSIRSYKTPKETKHVVIVKDVMDLIKELPNSSIQLIICDPPYNLNIANWDRFDSYLGWASKWIDEIPRILTDYGSFVIFGGLQYQDERGGDLLELMQYIRKKTSLRLVNLIIWYYTSGMSAHRFFANRHEEIIWFAKSKRYTFNLDAVRIPFDEKTMQSYLKDKRLNPENVRKGKNPTNVWEVPRLTGNAKERVGHPTQKPMVIIKRLVRALSNPGDVVLDFFAGTGVTTRVCIETGRHSIASDIDSKLNEYLSKLLEKMNLFISPYQILNDQSWRSHPVFKNNSILLP